MSTFPLSPQLVLEDFLFFSLYSFSCIRKASYDFETVSPLVLSCLDFVATNLEPLVLFSDITVL
jgi:hypothetical protein